MCASGGGADQRSDWLGAGCRLVGTGVVGKAELGGCRGSGSPDGLHYYTLHMGG